MLGRWMVQAQRQQRGGTGSTAQPELAALVLDGRELELEPLKPAGEELQMERAEGLEEACTMEPALC